jgi:uncharacterized membrane protein
VPRARSLFWAVVGLATLVRVVPAIRRPLEVDEAYTLHTAAMPLAQILRTLRELDVHPPLFWIVLHAVEAAHIPDVVVRLFMAALGVATVVVLFFIVRTWHSESAALIAAFCAAVMPSLIFYDITIRMYALFDFLALLSFAVLSILYTRDELPAVQRRLLWAVWTIVVALLLYTQYLGFFIVAAQLLYAGIFRREGLIRSLAGAGAAFALWIPQLSTFLYQLPSGGMAFPFYANHELGALYELVGQATVGVQTHGASYLAGWASLVGWAWLTIAIVVAVPGNGRALSVWLCVPAALTLAYGFVAHKLLYVDRYYLLLALGLCALSGIAAERLAARHNFGPAPGWAAGVALAAVGFIYAFNSGFYTADWPAVGGLLAARSQPSDLIIFDQGSPYFALDRLGALQHHPLILVFRRRDAESAIRLSQPFRRVWLVLFQSGPVDPDAHILHALAGRHKVGGYWEFFRRLPAEGASIVLFER